MQVVGVAHRPASIQILPAFSAAQSFPRKRGRGTSCESLSFSRPFESWMATSRHVEWSSLLTTLQRLLSGTILVQVRQSALLATPPPPGKQPLL